MENVEALGDLLTDQLQLFFAELGVSRKDENVADLDFLERREASICVAQCGGVRKDDLGLREAELGKDRLIAPQPLEACEAEQSTSDAGVVGCVPVVVRKLIDRRKVSAGKLCTGRRGFRAWITPGGAGAGPFASASFAYSRPKLSWGQSSRIFTPVWSHSVEPSLRR